MFNLPPRSPKSPNLNNCRVKRLLKPTTINKTSQDIQKKQKVEKVEKVKKVEKPKLTLFDDCNELLSIPIRSSKNNQTGKKQKSITQTTKNKSISKSSTKLPPPTLSTTPIVQSLLNFTSDISTDSKQSNLTLPVTLNTSAPTKPILTTSLDHYYWIQKPLPNEDWKVMACPISKGFNDTEIEPYPLYIEEEKCIGVPRFFGTEKYGKPIQDNTSLGEPMNPSVVFTWELQNTPQKPQKKAVDAWLKNQGKGILCLPCGTGKTVISIYLAILMKRKTLVLVHNEGLLHQFKENIEKMVPEAKVGIIRQQKCEIEGMDFVIGMIQTVRSTTVSLESFGMVIIDECHHIAAKTFSQAMLKTKPRYILGLSATPERKDGLTHVLHWLLGPIVFQTERKDISPQKIIQVEYPFGNQKVIKYRNGQIGIPTMVTRMTTDPKRNQLIDICLKKLINAQGIVKILVVSDRRDHLMYLNNLYGQEYDTGLYIGQLKKTELEDAKKKFIIFASYGMAQEFLDIPGLNGLLMASPCSANTEQVVGRLREGKVKVYPDEEKKGDYEKLFNHLCHSSGLYDAVVNQIKKSLQVEEMLPRYVYDIVDNFDVFEGMAWKRFRVYKRLDYNVKRMNMEEFLKE